MLIASLALTVALAQSKPLVCPMMGEPVGKDSAVVEYAGTSYAFCCGGCDTSFAKDPKAAIKANEKSASPIGAFLFDPVSHKAIKADKAKGSADYMATRYYFESAANLEAFNKDPKKYTAAPKKESLSCPVMGEAIATYSKASSYVDYKDVRYYICCAGCEPAFAKDPAKYAGKKVADPKPIAQKQG